MAMVFVRGKTRRMFSKAAGKSLATATTVSSCVSLSYRTRRCSTAVKSIGVPGKMRSRYRCTKFAAGAPIAMMRSGGFVRVESLKIIDEWCV